MPRIALPCIACGRELRNVLDSVTNQPHNGTTFQSLGHYGSTAFDPMDGHYLEINVCDSCLILRRDRVLEGLGRPVVEDGVFGLEPVTERLVHWWPSREVVDHVLDTTRDESNIDPPDPGGPYNDPSCPPDTMAGDE